MIKFIDVLKNKIKCRLPEKVNIPSPVKRRLRAFCVMVRTKQKLYFLELVKFFSERKTPKSKIPNLVLQLNLYVDE